MGIDKLRKSVFGDDQDLSGYALDEHGVLEKAKRTGLVKVRVPVKGNPKGALRWKKPGDVKPGEKVVGGAKPDEPTQGRTLMDSIPPGMLGGSVSPEALLERWHNVTGTRPAFSPEEVAGAMEQARKARKDLRLRVEGGKTELVLGGTVTPEVGLAGGKVVASASGAELPPVKPPTAIGSAGISGEGGGPGGGGWKGPPPPRGVFEAMLRIAKGDKGGATYVHRNLMTQQDRDAFGRFLVRIKHRLAEQAGSQESRFVAYVQEKVDEGSDLSQWQ